MVEEISVLQTPSAPPAVRGRTLPRPPKAPDLNRPKEVLEAFGLDSIKYVGSFNQKGKISAFVEVDGHVYTVGKGNYIGQNYGRITNIRADAINITELVENAYGNWTFRQTELILNGSE